MRGTVLASAFLWASSAAAQPFMPGQTYFSPDGYVEMIAGNGPLVLTVSHDGRLTPASMPDRTKAACANDPQFTFAIDNDTARLTRSIAQRMAEATGRHPWVIINHIRRSKLDGNRPRETGACGDTDTGRAWDQWHDYIERARATIVGRALQLDMHGHGFNQQQIQLGYQLTRDELYAPAGFAPSSSIHALALTYPGSFTSLVRDLGTRLTAIGYPAQPSVQDWTAEPGQGFYSGGYLTSRYGCQDIGANICAIQIEHNSGVRKTAVERSAYAQVLVSVLVPYLRDLGIVW